MRRLQQNDPNLAQMIQLCAAQPDNDENEYVLHNGALYHVAAPVARDDTNRLQLVVPSDLRDDILAQAHTAQFGGGHTGIDKTYDKLRCK